MSIQALLNAALAVSIFLAVLTEGMVISGADVRYLSSTPVRVARTPLAMNVRLDLLPHILPAFPRDRRSRDDLNRARQVGPTARTRAGSYLRVDLASAEGTECPS